MPTINTVDIMEIISTLRRPSRRLYSKEFKMQLVKECAEPGASIARVGLAHGINANLVHKWRRQFERGELSLSPAPEFLPVAMVRGAPLAAPARTKNTEPDLRIELTSSGLTASVHWPVSHAAQCAAWLRQLLA